ncbi:hypothetical protein N7471_012912 [Penicillium samsonianum]|uniref:uncharacterized protein n=1 Tax=Penicillium samsonianum TaxID=1882272 RepID=UPI00254921AA|nr:uncharacterized protein N7471_012912 [Penicillium samsonianum]KAJ6125595.1 hypothetical protein N7471_012912 [Penicillium samsonianum]
MAEETRRCRTCNKERPQDAFQAPETAGKEFYKLCEPCRTKFRNKSRAKRAKGDKGRARPYYLPESAPQTDIHTSNSETGTFSESTSAVPKTTMSMQPNCLHADSSHSSRVTVAPPVVESSAQSTTTTTVITISTTVVSKNVTETTTKPEQDAKTAQDGTQQVKDEDKETLSSGPESEQQSEIEAGINQRPEFFGCLHCEKLRPWPMAGLHICLLCIRDWKWCTKGEHNQAKANFLWHGKEHDECYMCYFAGI